jgi:hypothetical protein
MYALIKSFYREYDKALEDARVFCEIIEDFFARRAVKSFLVINF